MHQTTLEALWGSGDDSVESTAARLDVFDFFCGCGGFSEGCIQAGHRVVFACDNNHAALAVHAKNHRDATHMCASLPVKRCQLPFPTDGSPFHVHGSPPCTTFSTMNCRSGGEALATGRTNATRLVHWYLKMVLASGCTSWTMEQVPSPLVLAVVERVRRKNLNRMDYGIFEFRGIFLQA